MKLVSLYNHLESTIEKYMQYKARIPKFFFTHSDRTMVPHPNFSWPLSYSSADIPEEEIMEHTDHRFIESVRKNKQQSKEMC